MTSLNDVIAEKRRIEEGKVHVCAHCDTTSEQVVGDLTSEEMWLCGPICMMKEIESLIVDADRYREQAWGDDM